MEGNWLNKILADLPGRCKISLNLLSNGLWHCAFDWSEPDKCIHVGRLGATPSIALRRAKMELIIVLQSI